MCQSSNNYMLAKTKHKIKLKFLDLGENENPFFSVSRKEASVF